jgi:hypothetical protein
MSRIPKADEKVEDRSEPEETPVSKTFEIEKDFIKSAYDKYQELFRHYSALLFQARILIISLNLILIGYNFGYLKVESIDSQDNYVKGGICFMSAVALLLFYSMETVYIKRLKDVADSIGNLEKNIKSIPCDFFRKYKPMHHWSLLIFYGISNIALLYKYLVNIQYSWWGYIFLIFPFILFVGTFLNQRKLSG